VNDLRAIHEVFDDLLQSYPGDKFIVAGDFNVDRRAPKTNSQLTPMQQCSRDFGARLVSEGFFFVPSSRTPTYYVGQNGISTLDYCFFDTGISVRAVCPHLCPRVSHAGLSMVVSIPFAQKGTFLHFPCCILRQILFPSS
jgi:hypothetical protein